MAVPRYLGVDYGDARTGLAVSDTLGMLANGIGYIASSYDKEVARKIKEACDTYSISLIVLGYPINMNGTKGPRCEKIEQFAALLREETGLPVELFDERLSTVVAHRFLTESNVRAKKKKTVVDTLSAQIILQNYMDAHSGK